MQITPHPSSEPSGATYAGHFIRSFNVALLQAAPGSQITEPTVGFAFLLRHRETRVLKFTRGVLVDLSYELSGAFSRFPDADQRERIAWLVDRADRGLLTDTELLTLREHPISGYLLNIPSIPADMATARPSHYVTLVHIDAHPDVFLFDVTFADQTTERFSLATSVVGYLVDKMSSALAKLDALYDGKHGAA